MHRLPRAFRLRQAYHIRPRPSHLTSIPRRSQSQLIYRSDGEPIRQQRVRFKKPRMFTLRRLRNVIFYTGAVYLNVWALFYFSLIRIEIVSGEDEVEDNQQEEAEGEGEGEGEGKEEADTDEEIMVAEEDSLFIPLTWSKKQPRVYYKGSDPEWKEFIKLSKDPARQKQIQDELVLAINKMSQQHPVTARFLGKDSRVRKFWLELSYPDGPPPEHVRFGLEFGDDYVALAKQKVDQEDQWRLRRTLWPEATASSVWAMTRTLMGIQYRRVKQALGWEGKDPSSPEERYKHVMQIMEKQKQKQSQERKQVGEAQTDPGGNASAVVGSQPTQNSAQASATNKGAGKNLLSSIQVPMPSVPGQASTDWPVALHVFGSTLAKSWHQPQPEPPRGTVLVSGLIDVTGERGRILFDVQGFYDPKASRYTTIIVGSRSRIPRKQRARGGP